MTKRRILRLIIWAVIIMAIFLPGFSKLQEMRSKNEKIEQEILRLKEENLVLEEEVDRLDNDPVYLEAVAREKMNLAREGEVIYKILPDE